MRKLRIAIAIMLALLAFTSGKTANAAPVVEEDVVASLNTANSDVPVGVAFGSPVRFSYDVAGPRLTLVEPAQ